MYSLASKLHLLLFLEVVVMVSVTSETRTLVHSVRGCIGQLSCIGFVVKGQKQSVTGDG